MNSGGGGGLGLSSDPRLVAILDPTSFGAFGFGASKTVLSAPNAGSAGGKWIPGTSAQFAGQGAAPVWSATALGNGSPGFLFGAGTNATLKLNAIGSTFTGAAGVSLTLIARVAPTLPTSVGYTPLMIGSTTDPTPGPFIFLLDGPDCSPPGDTAHYAWNVDYVQDDGTGDNFVEVGAPHTAGVHVVTMVRDATSVRCRVDGVQVGSTPTTATGPITCDQIAIGASADASANAFGAFYWIGALGYVLAFNEALPVADLSRYETWLAST